MFERLLRITSPSGQGKESLLRWSDAANTAQKTLLLALLDKIERSKGAPPPEEVLVAAKSIRTFEAVGSESATTYRGESRVPCFPGTMPSRSLNS